MYNAYQLEPVLYMTPDDIKSGAEYAAKGVQGSSLGGGNVKVESYPGEVAPLVVSQGQQYEMVQQAHLGEGNYQLEASPPAHSLGQYEAVQQQVPSNLGATHSDGVTSLATLSSHGTGQQSGGYLYGEPQYQQQGPPPPPPVTLLADASLLDTYMKYASLSTQDVLLPVYQQTQHLPTQHQQQQQITTSYVSSEQQPLQQHQQTYQLEEATSGGGYLPQGQRSSEAFAAPFSEAALLHQDLQRITPIASAHPESGKAY